MSHYKIISPPKSVVVVSYIRPKKNMCVSGYPTLPNFFGPKTPTLNFFLRILVKKIKFRIKPSFTYLGP